MKYFIKQTAFGATIAFLCCAVFAAQHDPTNHLSINNKGELTNTHSASRHAAKQRQQVPDSNTPDTYSTTNEGYFTEQTPYGASQRGNWIFRGGVANIMSSSKKNKVKGNIGPISVNNADLTAKTKSVYTGTLSLTFLTNEGLAVELATLFPTKLDLDVRYGNQQPQKEGDFQYHQLALTVQYHFFPQGEWDPYIGVGAAYNSFKKNLTKTEKGLGLESRWSSSISPVVQAGIDYYFSENWLINAALNYSRVEAKFDIKNPLIGGYKLRYKYDQFIPRVTVGWRF